MIRVDLHVHTIYSSDASTHPKLIVEQLYAHPFIKAVAITDHNTLEGFFKVSEFASAYQDIVIVPGVEVATVEGDLIVLGVTELPPKPWLIETVIDFAKERDGLVVAPHPYRAYGLGELTKNCAIDAVEVLNGLSSPKVNKLAENLARTMALPGVAGSDAHEANELWTAHTEVQASLHVDEILKAIRKGLVSVTSTTSSINF